jgi:hypothetical protein
MTNLTQQLKAVLDGIKDEITVDTEGKGSITKYGLTKLLSISPSVLHCDRLPQKLVEMLTELGFTLCDLEFKKGIPDLAVACIIEYYAMYAQRTSETAKLLTRAFNAVGVRAWMQDIKGYYKPAPTSQLDHYKQAVAAMTSMIAVMEYAANKPGQQNINNFVLDTNGKTLQGLLTIEDILNKVGRVFSTQEKSAIGMYAATAYRNLTGLAPTKIKVTYIDKVGKTRYKMLAAYPVDFLPVIENASELGFNS